MQDNIAYDEHLHDMSEKKIEDLSDEKKLFMLNRIISCLPNNGKLYKYRNIEGQSFDYAYDSLLNGYIWLSPACDFNDDEDTILYYDPELEAEQLKKYIFEHPDLVFRSAYRASSDIVFGGNMRSHIAYGKVLECFDEQTGEIIEQKAIVNLVKNGYGLPESKTFVSELKKFTSKFLVEKRDLFEDIVNSYLHFNEEHRKQSLIFSMTESYDNNIMWGYYANSSKGFCIEYDYKKALSLDVETRNKLISVFKVIYSDEENLYSFIPILDYILKGQTDSDEYRKISYGMTERLITKKTKWDHENEWRIFLYNIDNKLHADLVSGIIIDERIINTENGQKLLALCNDKKWNITVRTMNLIRTKHIYLPYENWKSSNKK